MEYTPERRRRFISSLAEGARQNVSSALGLLEGADDPEIAATFRPLIERLEAVRRDLNDMI